MAPKILIAEDDQEIASVMVEALQDLNPRLDHVTSGEAAMEKAADGRFDLFILDLGLIGAGGMEVCRAIRKSNELTPILIVSSRAQEIDKVLALELGADDYLTKPFGVRELLARARALLRRSGLAEAQRGQGADVDKDGRLHAGELVLSLNKHELSRSGKTVELTRMEFQLLALLMSNRGRVLTREEIVSEIAGYPANAYSKTVDVHISRLRDKIEDDPKEPRYVLTVRGLGYRFADDEELAK